MSNAIPLLIEITTMRGGEKFKEIIEVSTENIANFQSIEKEIKGDIKDMLSRPGLMYTVKTIKIDVPAAQIALPIDIPPVQGNQVILLVISFVINVLPYILAADDPSEHDMNLDDSINEISNDTAAISVSSSIVAPASTTTPEEQDEQINEVSMEVQPQLVVNQQGISINQLLYKFVYIFIYINIL